MAQAPKSDAAIVQTLRKAQGMLRQLSQEKADLEAKNAALDERVKALEARVRQLEPLEGQVKQQKLNLEALQGSNAALQQRISGDAERLRALGERQRQLGAELEKYRRDNRLLVDAVKERGRWIEQCAGKNRSLLEVNRELLKNTATRASGTSSRRSNPSPASGRWPRKTLSRTSATSWRISRSRHGGSRPRHRKRPRPLSRVQRSHPTKARASCLPSPFWYRADLKRRVPTRPLLDASLRL